MLILEVEQMAQIETGGTTTTERWRKRFKEEQTRAENSIKMFNFEEAGVWVFIIETSTFSFRVTHLWGLLWTCLTPLLAFYYVCILEENFKCHWVALALYSSLFGYIWESDSSISLEGLTSLWFSYRCFWILLSGGLSSNLVLYCCHY